MTNVYTDLLLSDGAIDLWMLDDASGTNAANIGPSAHVMTYSGTYNQNAPGVLPSYLSTRFSSGYVVSSVDVLSGASAFSFSVLLRVQFLADCYAVAYDSGANSNTESWYLFTYVSTVSTSGGIFQSAGVVNDTSGLPNLGNSWHQCVLTWDGTNLRNYLDGNFTGIVGSSAWFKPGALRLSIGGDSFRAAASSSRFQGFMSAAALFTAALTPAQVAAQFEALSSIAITPVGQPATSGQLLAVQNQLELQQAQLDLIYAAVHKVYV